MMTICVDRGRCTGLGICESFAPDVFEVDDDGNLVLSTEGTRATGLDTRQRVVQLGADEIPYDGLVVATGATPRIPGSENLAGVHTLRTLDDARAVRAALDAGARTVVVGAGFIGSEVASAARKRDLPVTIVEALPTPLTRAVGPAMAEACSALHRAHGTELLCGAAVDASEGNGRVERVRPADGTVLTADLVVVGVGTTPEASWLDGSGLTVDDGIDVVLGDIDSGRFVALYRSGDRLTGALTVNKQREIMKFRALIARRATWAEALVHARQRREPVHAD
jgi:NADPH-dependent 2,4-dienoyl-CoA reductase/sulfur reductase-like enzyme